MTHLERKRIVREVPEQRVELVDRLGTVLEAPRVLKQDGAEASGGGEGVEVVAKCLDVVCAKLRVFVREAAKALSREFEIGSVRHAAHPALRMRRRRDSIEGRVDLDGVEEAGKIGELVEFGTVFR